MAHSYFHLHECGSVTTDEEGIDLCDLAAAHAQAVVGARDVMIGEVRGGRLCLACCIVITDERNYEVDRVSFRDAIAISAF